MCVCVTVHRIKNPRLLFNKDLNHLEVEVFRLVFVEHVLHVEGTFVAQLQALQLHTCNACHRSNQVLSRPAALSNCKTVKVIYSNFRIEVEMQIL